MRDRDTEKICGVIVDEMDKLAEKGLNTSNIDVALKLIDMYKDLSNTKYWDAKCEYYMAILDEMQDGGSSYGDGEYSGRHRDSRGRYASNDGRMTRDRGEDGYSMRGRGEHYVRGHYSRSNGDDYDRYMEHKRSYRSGEKSADCKQRMIDALERHMDSLTEEIADMSRDADCGEERQVLQKYIDKLKRMM